MILNIVIIFFLMACWTISTLAFVKIKFDVQYLIEEKERNLDLIKKFMGKVITHEDMKRYVDEIREEGEKIASLKDNYQKEKWQNLKQAFSRKKEEEI